MSKRKLAKGGFAYGPTVSLIGNPEARESQVLYLSEEKLKKLGHGTFKGKMTANGIVFENVNKDK